MGLIVAYMGAVQLAQFGAQIYIANLVGIGGARQHAAEKLGIDAALDGIGALPEPRVYASPEVHHVVTRAMGVLGLGRRNLRSVALDADLPNSASHPSFASASGPQAAPSAPWLDGERHHHSGLQVLGDVAVEHPLAGIRYFQEKVHGRPHRQQRRVLPSQVLIRHSVAR